MWFLFLALMVLSGIGVIIFLILTVMKKNRARVVLVASLGIGAFSTVAFIVAIVISTPANDGNVETAAEEVEETVDQEERDDEKEKEEPAKDKEEKKKSNEGKKKDKPKTGEKKKEDKNDDLVLPFTVNEFRENFDKAADEFALPFRSNKTAKVEEGEVNDTQQVLTASDYVNIFATLNKEGDVLSINLIGIGDGSEDSGFEIISVIGTSIAAAQPELTEDDRGDILKELGVLDEGSFGEMMSTNRNGFTYSLSIDEATGVMFFIEP